MALDKRARKILFDMFWSSTGWKREPTVSKEELAYAKAKGLMFDSILLSHDDAVEAAIKAVARTTRKAVTRAFIASLGSRRLELRSALGSYAVGRHMLAHSHISSAGSSVCAYCGEYEQTANPNVLNFERIKWGGVRHSHPRYIALDLDELSTECEVVPTDEDYLILRSILDAARGAGEKARLGDLNRALSGLLPSNSSERRTLIQILGYAGILIDPSRPDFRLAFVPIAERERTPWHTDDWSYPVQWWTGPCGVNETAIEEWFPELANGSYS